MAVDRQQVARTVSELRAALPEADDLLVGLLRVAEATRTMLEADGAGLTLVHEDGPPRWVAATDVAMELLEQVQHDFGEGPSLQAYAQDRAVVIEDLRAAAAWTRIDAVVGQLSVWGRERPHPAPGPAGRDLGRLQHPAAGLGLPRARRDGLVRQRGRRARADQRGGRHAGAGGGPAAAGTDQPNLDRAGQRGPGRHPGHRPRGGVRAAAAAGAGVLAQAGRAGPRVVQDAQRERLAALALDDVRVREAEARAQAAEQALQAAQADLTRRRATLDQAEVATEERDRIANERNHAADARDRAADAREHLADDRDRAADERERMADDRDRIADERDRVADERDRTAGYHD